MKRPDTERGFTLVEVMIAVLLSAIAVIGIIGLYTVETRSSAVSRRKTEAAMLAQDKVEELRTMPAPTGQTTGTETNVDEHGNAGGIFTRSWSIDPQGTPAGDFYMITVTVTWDTYSVVVRADRGAT